MNNKIKCIKCSSSDIYVLKNDNTYICNKCGYEKLDYSIDDIKLFAKANVYMSNVLALLDIVDCKCEEEYLYCIKCDLIERAKAIQSDLNDIVNDI